MGSDFLPGTANEILTDDDSDSSSASFRYMPVSSSWTALFQYVVIEQELIQPHYRESVFIGISNNVVALNDNLLESLDLLDFIRYFL